MSQPPIAKRVDSRREFHGDVFVDPYEWLRDKSSPEVLGYLEAENEFADQATAPLEPLRQKIFDEIRARTKETDLSVPVRRGDWWYYGRSFEGKQYGVQCRCPVADPSDWDPPVLDEHVEIPGEQVLLDENVEAEGHDFFSLGAASLSPDGNVLAYSVDVVGDERYTLRFRDIRTGEQYPDEIVGIGAGATWGTDNRTVYYVTVDAAWRPDTVWRHRLASGLSAEKVYHEADEKYWLAVGRTRSDKYVLIAAGSAITSEIRYADAADSSAEFVTVLPRRDGIEYSVEHAIVGGQDRFLIMHNENAVNFMLADAPVEDPAAQRTLIENRDDVRLDGVDAFAGHLVVSYRGAALPKIQLWPINDHDYGRPEEISFDSELMSAGLGANPNWDSPKLRVGRRIFRDSGPDLRPRPGHRGAHVAARAAGAGRLPPRGLRRTPVNGRRLPTEPRSRSRSFIAPASNSLLRHWYTGMAPTRSVRIHGFRSLDFRCWIAAWSSPSPTYAAAARWVDCGTSTASCSRRRTASPISSLSDNTWSTADRPVRSSWWRWAEAPAAC